MKTLVRHVLAGGALFGAALVVTEASADVQACLDASEKGQQARAAGKLREAREQFLICGNKACPPIVRRDCAQWNAEVAQALPTVAFGAKDRDGRDLFDVTVSMDGEPLVKKLDGKSVTLDPGKHLFRFEAAGFAPVIENALIKEGERSRVINVTFDELRRDDQSQSHAAHEAPKQEGERRRGHTPYPWIVVGIGALGIAAGASIVWTAPDRPSNCDADTQKCTRLAGQSDADFAADRRHAGTADSQPVLGYVVAGAGLALVAGGLAWHFLEPTADTKRSTTGFRVRPWTTGLSSGATLEAIF